MSDNGAVTKGLYTKLAEVSAEVGRVEKRGENTFHKYKYVKEDDLLDEVRDKLSSRNIILLPSVVRQTRDDTLTTVYVRFTFLDGDADTTDKRVGSHSCEWVGTGDDKGDKGLYKAYTGALKYFLMKTFLIPTGDDPEGDKKTDERTAKASSGAKAKPVPEKRAEALYDLWKHSAVDPARLGLWLVQNGSEDVDAGSEDSLAKAISALPSDKADALEAKLREKVAA